MVDEVIEWLYGITLGEGAVGRIVRERMSQRMSLSPQRPGQRARKADDGQMVHEYLDRMAATPRLIRVFFEERFCRYAKA